MESKTYLLEQMVFAITWALLSVKMFPRSKSRNWIVGIAHILLTSGIVTLWDRTAARQVGPIVSVGICSGLIWMASKRKDISVISENLVTYILAKALWLSSVFIIYFLLWISGKSSVTVMVESVAVCIQQIILCLVAVKSIHTEWWESIASKYSSIIVALTSFIFIVSYAIILISYDQKRREFYFFALVVLMTIVVILIIWAFNDYQHRKELEAKSKHIDDLVRGAHRYKEIIPAVSRELRKIAQEMGGEVSSELSIAIEEVDQLWNMTARQDREERKKAPNLNQTGLPLLDGQLEQEWREADAAGVSFECVVISPVGELAERVELFHLMQLVGDLFRNALRAIQRSGGENGRILLFLGKRREGYEIKMRDTGAPFPKEVLERLGERGLTTGGTGHGMADMLETLARYRASLEIQEEMETTAFTKTVSLLFDNEAMVRVNCPAQSIVYERHLPELTKI